jgi:hypothetical protein
MFPDVEVELSDGTRVKLRPLPLSKLGMFTGTFVRLYEAALLSPNYSGVMEKSVEEFLALFSSICDTPADEIYALDVFELMGIFVSQNVTDRAIKNFSALIPQVTEIFNKVTTQLGTVNPPTTEPGDQGDSGQ